MRHGDDSLNNEAEDFILTDGDNWEEELQNAKQSHASITNYVADRLRNAEKRNTNLEKEMEILQQKNSEIKHELEDSNLQNENNLKEIQRLKNEEQRNIFTISVLQRLMQELQKEKVKAQEEKRESQKTEAEALLQLKSTQDKLNHLENSNSRSLLELQKAHERIVELEKENKSLFQSTMKGFQERKLELQRAEEIFLNSYHGTATTVADDEDSSLQQTYHHHSDSPLGFSSNEDLDLTPPQHPPKGPTTTSPSPSSTNEISDDESNKNEEGNEGEGESSSGKRKLIGIEEDSADADVDAAAAADMESIARKRKRNWTGAGKKSLLHLAAESGNKDGVVYLLEKKNIDVNILDEEGLTPLDYLAFKTGEIGTGTEFLREDKCLEIGRLLKNRGGTFATKATREQEGQTETLLHLAAAQKGWQGNWRVKLFLHLLEFPVNVTDQEGNTPLHLAYKSITPVTEVGEFTDIIAYINNNETPSEAVTEWRLKKEVIKILITSGANVNAKNNNGLAPFQMVDDLKIPPWQLSVIKGLMKSVDWRKNDLEVKNERGASKEK